MILPSFMFYFTLKSKPFISRVRRGLDNSGRLSFVKRAGIPARHVGESQGNDDKYEIQNHHHYSHTLKNMKQRSLTN